MDFFPLKIKPFMLFQRAHHKANVQACERESIFGTSESHKSTKSFCYSDIELEDKLWEENPSLDLNQVALTWSHRNKACSIDSSSLSQIGQMALMASVLLKGIYAPGYHC